MSDPTATDDHSRDAERLPAGLSGEASDISVEDTGPLSDDQTLTGAFVTSIHGRFTGAIV